MRLSPLGTVDTTGLRYCGSCVEREIYKTKFERGLCRSFAEIHNSACIMSGFNEDMIRGLHSLLPIQLQLGVRKRGTVSRMCRGEQAWEDPCILVRMELSLVYVRI
jgi:hypothetical protein